MRIRVETKVSTGPGITRLMEIWEKTVDHPEWVLQSKQFQKMVAEALKEGLLVEIWRN